MSRATARTVFVRRAALAWVVLVALALLSADYWFGGMSGIAGRQLLLAILIPGLIYVFFRLIPERIALRLHLLLAALFLACLLTEGLLRLFFPQPSLTVYRRHPTYLYELLPNSSRLVELHSQDGGAKNVVQINSQGNRGAEDHRDPDSMDTPEKIIVYGDSFIEAEFTPLEKTFVQQLENRLAENSDWSPEVINAGVVGYGPDQILLRMQDELPKLKPKIAIVAFYCSNDFSDLLRNKLFTLDAKGELLRREPRVDAWMDFKFFAAQSKLHSVRLVLGARRSWIQRQTAPASDVTRRDMAAFWDQKFSQTQSDFQDYLNSDVVTRIPDSHTNLDVCLTPDAESSKHQILLARAIFKKMKQLADANGTELLLMVIPMRQDLVEEEAPPDLDKFPQYHPEGLTDLVLRLAEECDIEAIDLFPVFKKHSPRDLYYRYDSHWNDAGQALATETVRERLRSRLQGN